MASRLSDYIWVLFIASADERLLHHIIQQQHNIKLSQYRINDITPVIGMPPTTLVPGLTVVRLENDRPIPVAEESLSRNAPSLIIFRGVTQHLHYTTTSQSQELDTRSRAEFESSLETRAVLIPIRKSQDWWQLPQDRRQSHFQASAVHPGHTAIGIRYVDRVFRKLYHSRYISPTAAYDFLTYFEFNNVHRDDFKMLLGELRDTARNPEWAYIDLEYEMWMTKIG